MADINKIMKWIRRAGCAAGAYSIAAFPGFHRKKKWEQFTGWDYAHRGLHNVKAGIPENSLLAFENAIRHGYAIELDVRLTADNQLVVMHDDNLLRICHVNRKISKSQLADLEELTLQGTQEKIPLFRDVLELINGQVPLLIELKAEHFDQDLLCPLVWQLLQNYRGNYCIESFNPLVVQWFAIHHPKVLRGQLSCDFFRDSPHCDLSYFLVTNLLTNFLSHPDFISYRYTDTDNPAFLLNKYIYRSLPMVWTIHSIPAYHKYKKRGNIIIFENIRP